MHPRARKTTTAIANTRAARYRKLLAMGTLKVMPRGSDCLNDSSSGELFLWETLLCID